MSIRKLLSCLLLFFLLIMPDICFSSTPGISPEISQLNNPRYRVGCDTGGPMHEKTLKYFPNAQILFYNSLLDAYHALKTGKIDALVCSESEMMSAMKNGINDAKFLPGYLGEPVGIAAGLSDHSKIPGLKEKFNAFIAKIKADGTFNDMLKRWVYDGNTNMPDINVPEKSDIHLTVGTTGLVVPFSFYIGKDVTGFDIELARRFAADIGAALEFKISDFGGILMFIHEGMTDIALSNLYYNTERSENLTFSDIIFTVNAAVVVRDEGNTRNPAIMASGKNMQVNSVREDGKTEAIGKFSAFRGKRIGVATGSVHYDMVKKAIPDAEISYFDTLANIINAVEANKIDAFALDEPVILNIEREKPNITHIDESLGNIDNAFIFAKNDYGNKLRDEFNEFMSRIKSDGTLKEIRSIWFGEDDSKKIAADYEKFTDKNGIIHIALNPEDPPFSYMQDNRLTGYDVDIILRFCAEKSYRPEFSGMNFAGIIPAVNSGKYDIGMGGITITPERAESVNFSSPVYTGSARLMILKTAQNAKPLDIRNMIKSQERIPKYKTLHELDGKTIGIQTGVDVWEKIARKILPNSKIVFYNTFADLAAALKSHKIEAFFADEPVYNLMATEDNNLAKIDEKIDDYYSIAYGFPKNEKGRKLCDEINEYIRMIKANGELDAIISKWEGADESAKTLPDYKNFPAPKGILNIATEGEYAPFNYYRGNEIAGFEIDIAARFCEANGYGLKITSMIWDSVVPAIVSGKYDFAAAALAPNDEHSKEIIFSEPYSKSRSVMVCLKAEDSPVQNVSRKSSLRLSDFDGKNIGMQPGVADWEEWVAENLPHSKVQYYNTYPDLAFALKTHKISGFLVDSPVLALMSAEDNSITAVDEPVGKPFGYSFFYAKTEAGKKLCDEMSEYIRKIKASGELDEILSKWQGADEAAKIPPDFKNLPAKNGTLTYAAEATYPPFTYYKGTDLAGIDIDIVVRFCREYGYGLNIQTMLFDAMIPAVNSGKVDFAGDFTPSEEHEEAVYFSEPYCMAHSVMACLKAEDSPVQPVQNVSRKSSPKFSDFDGKPVGIQAGVPALEKYARKFLPHSEILYYNSYADIGAAIRAGKIASFFVDSPVLALMSAEDPRFSALDENIEAGYYMAYGFPKTEAGKKLCGEMSEYIRRIKASGELEAIIKKWTGADESVKVIPNYKKFHASKGVLKMVTEGEYPPMNYFKGNDLAGIDIDIAVRFCEAYGYGLNITAMSYGAIVPAVASGKFDFAGADLSHNHENAAVLNFSEPYYRSRTVAAYLRTESQSHLTELDSLAGKKIGVQTGTTCAELVPEKIPSAELAYFNSLTDQLAALRAGKVEAICCSLPAAIFTENADPTLTRIDPPLRETYLYPIFSQTEKGRKLCEEYSAFLKTLWDNGTINALNEKWLGSDESKKVTEDYSALPSTNGTVIMAVDTSLVPFAYVKDNRITGYDIDLAVMFCKSKGYALEIQNMPLTGVIASVKAGKSDFTQSLNKTPERSENTLFTSTPAIKSGNVLLKKKSQNIKQYTVNISLSEFDGKKIGIHTGSNSEFVTAERIPSAKLVYYDSQANMIEALRQGKIDAMSCGEASAIYLAEENDDLALVSEPLRKTYRSVAFVSSDKGLKLRDEWGEFLKTLWDNVTISKLFDKWILNNGESSKSEDFSELPSINGTLKMAADVALIPFVYVKDNRIQGYDIDLAVMFCRSKGYGLKIIQLTHSGILAALASGKCDFSYAMEYTEERAKSVLFSEVPNIETANVLVVLKSSEKKLSAPESVSRVSHISHEEKPSFWEDIVLSFKKTFIREDRWKLFAEGIMNTMIITVSSVFCGMLLGFAAFMACRKGNKISNAITKFSVWLIKGTPIVVLLMILYYVIFGHVNISGIIVAIIAFTLTFGTSVYRMLTFGTGAVDKGQTEAAYALGFTDMQTFFTVILPQAALHFMPSFREEVTMLIKSTSVVGYIAVQDLTKMGDIVRSRTYEAFFPLIAVAVIYFILAGLLNIIVTFIEFQITPSRRKPEDILHGIDTARGNENHD